MTAATDLLFQPLSLQRGPSLKNRFMLAPMTNLQSHPNGLLSDDEFHWLTMRAKGGFGQVMTCAAHVQAQGQGFGGQLGIFCDDHLPRLSRLAAAINQAGAVSAVQLHHAGRRAPKELVGDPVCASDDPESGARAITLGEIERLVESFVEGAVRAEKAGFHGAEIHGAHSYIITQFLSPELNRRDDRYGGSLENRSRLLFEIIDGIRARTGPDFQLGVRLSPERFGLVLPEMLEVVQQVFREARVEYVDMSLWDYDKQPEDEAFKGRSLIDLFTGLDRGQVRLGVAGQIFTARQAADAVARGADTVLVGRAAILHHDFPQRVREDAGFEPIPFPVSREHLAREGVAAPFLDYLAQRPNFVAA